jgi:acetoacetate decarboxylase
MSNPPMTRPGEVAGWPKLVIKYRTDEANVGPLLPPGIVPLDPTVTIGIYCVPVLGEPEFGASVKVEASWNDVAGQYNLGMGIDQEAAVHISGELNGQPKFLCEIHYHRLSDQIGARVTHQGYTFIEFDGTVAGEEDAGSEPFTEHEWWTKYSRAIGGAEKEYDFEPVVVDVATSFIPKHREVVEGELTLRDSPWDPIASYLPMEEFLSARLITNQPTARDITNAGPLDPDAFWPYADVIGGSRWPGDRGGPRRG